MTKNNKIIVLGAAGFLGQNLVPELIKKNYEVIGIDKHKNNLDLLKKLNPLCKTYLSDLSKKSKWQELFKQAEIIIQLNAQIASPTKEPFIKNNVTATKNIINAMKKTKNKYIIHISSASVLSIRQDNYAKTKQEAEDLIIMSKINYTILRPSMMYGLYDNKNVGWLVQFSKKMPIFPVPGTGRYPRQPVYVKDMCNIILKLIKEKPKNKIFNINSDAINFIDMIKIILKSRKLKRLIIKIPVPLFILMMKIYNFILRKVEFTSGQVKSLTTGETFEIFDWEKNFEVKKTSFEKGMKLISDSQKKDIILER